MKIVEDLEQIRKYQMQLKSKFFFNADKRPKPLLTWKAPTGKVAWEVNYASNLRIWGCYIMNPYNTIRHWNGFGVGEPIRGKSAPIDFTINFANSQDDRSQDSVFVENKEGEILICHNGTIGRNKDLFWEKYTGELLDCTYSDQTTGKFALVANLNGGECLKEIASFVKMVKIMKKKK